MKKRLLPLLLLLLLPTFDHAQLEQHSHRQPLVLTHVTIIDATGAPAKPDMTVVITGERVAALGPTTLVNIPQKHPTGETTWHYASLMRS